MQEKIMKLIKDSTISIPKLLIFNYKKLNMTDFDFILVSYLLNLKNLEFNPSSISEELSVSLNEVLESVDHLSSINLLKLDLKKVNGVRGEYINLDYLYDKLLYLVINEEEKESIPTNIFSTFETEFGRTLAPMEYEIINSWIDSGYKEELIISALKEAVFNGVFKLNYIDKILYEWDKKGIKNTNEVEKNRQEFSKKKGEKKELYDYNWLEEE